MIVRRASDSQQGSGATGGYNRFVELEKTLLRKVGEAIHRFKMIRDGDRVAVALSGGKDSLTLLEALLLLEKRAPIEFSVCAFTVEQGKFLRPIEPLGDYLKQRGIAWTYFRDAPSFRLLEEQPDHGCDLCSRYRRRAVYEIARGLGANVIAFGHTADDFCEALLRNTMFTGRLSALPPVTHSTEPRFPAHPAAGLRHRGDYARLCGIAGRARRALWMLTTHRHGPPLAARHFRRTRARIPAPERNILSAMGNVDTRRLLDTRYMDLDGAEPAAEETFPILTSG